MPRIPSWSLLVVAVALGACTADGPSLAEQPVRDAEATTPSPREAPPTEEEATPTPAPRDCRVDRLATDGLVDMRGQDPVATSHALTARTHTCADRVVVAADDGWTAALAVSVAVDADAPLLLIDPTRPAATLDVVAELAPEEVVTVGDVPDVFDVDGPALRADDASALALAVIEHLEADRAYAVAIDDEESRVAAAARHGGTTPLFPVDPDDEVLAAFAAELPPTLRVEVVAPDAATAGALADRLVDVGVDAEPTRSPRWEEPTGQTLWLVDPRQGSTAAAVSATAVGRGELVLPIHADDLRRGRDRAALYADADPERAVLVGDVTDDADWQLPMLLRGPRLPTGGLTLFEHERIVALYGTPSSTRLGALGEQDLDATVVRAREVAEPYGADGREVVPAFEIITTIASAEAGERGDYSRRVAPETIRPWIDRAADEGFYVILDLQPGRTDFLEQAREYEELLLEPHVGLALDPEWRLEDDQVHLRQIGNVPAEEVQRVADWLAALVREHRLPQKLLVLHQFRLSMLPDRDELVAPTELAVVVHMDGQGEIGTKFETYDAITAGAEDRWLWGWKNFYDEDRPTPTPEQVLELDPLPVFVSYQ